MFRNTCVVDLEEYVKLRARVEHLERERKEIFSVIQNYSDEPRLCVNVAMFKEEIEAQLGKTEFVGTHKLAIDLREWSRTLDVFDRIKEDDEEDEE